MLLCNGSVWSEIGPRRSRWIMSTRCAKYIIQSKMYSISAHDRLSSVRNRILWNDMLPCMQAVPGLDFAPTAFRRWLLFPFIRFPHCEFPVCASKPDYTKPTNIGYHCENHHCSTKTIYYPTQHGLGRIMRGLQAWISSRSEICGFPTEFPL